MVAKCSKIRERVKKITRENGHKSLDFECGEKGFLLCHLKSVFENKFGIHHLWSIMTDPQKNEKKKNKDKICVKNLHDSS